MQHNYKLLLVDDDREWGITFISELSPLGFDIVFETQAENSVKRMSSDIDGVLLDIMWPVDTGGHVNRGKTTLQKIKLKYPNVPVIMLTNTMGSDYNKTDYPGAAFAYGKDSFESGDERVYLNFAELIKGEIKKRGALTSESARYGFIIGKNHFMESVCNAIDIASRTKEPALITGETGTGKESVARAIHKLSGCKGPLIIVNCGAFTETLLESELFGHEKGAFTGATGSRMGAFETASEGSVFLDEIGDAPVKVQVELLRVLQEGEIRRVGSSHPILVNSRIIAATNKNLDEEVSAGRFRKDLLYRMKVIQIHLPPLRERIDDIAELAEHFILKFNSKHLNDYKTPSLRKDVIALLQGYDWPGNIRELGNAVYSAALNTRSNWLLPCDFKIKESPADDSSAKYADEIITKFRDKEISFKEISDRINNGSPEMIRILRGICRWCYLKEKNLTEDLLVEYLGLNTRANVHRVLKDNAISTMILKQEFKNEP